MNVWPLRTLGDLVALQRGIDLPENTRGDGDVPVMGSFGVSGSHDVAACSGPGVIVGRSGASAGTVSYVKQDYWPLNTCLYVKDFRGNDPQFVYYFLKTFDLAGMNSGSAQPSLNRNVVHPTPARFPEPELQQAIASVLSALDDKIDLNRRMNATLEASARAVFRDWFVDFGPVRAKMAAAGEGAGGGAREGSTHASTPPATTPYLPSHLWSLFPDRLDEEGVPEGWTWSTIGDQVEVVGGSTPSTKIESYWDGGVAWTTPKDLSGLRSLALFDTARTITTAGLATVSSGLLPAGTLLMSSRAPVGYLAISQIPLAVNQGYIAMICEKSLSNCFAYLWCKENMETILQHANGSTFQ